MPPQISQSPTKKSLCNLWIVSNLKKSLVSMRVALLSIEDLSDFVADDELLVFSDLMGGSITNQILRYGLRENVHVVSGMNLPLLIDIMLADADTPVKDVIENAISIAREQVVYVNSEINKGKDHD